MSLIPTSIFPTIPTFPFGAGDTQQWAGLWGTAWSFAKEQQRYPLFQLQLLISGQVAAMAPCISQQQEGFWLWWYAQCWGLVLHSWGFQCRGAHLAAAGDVMLSNRRACTYLRWPCSLCGFLATGSCVQLPHSIYDKRGELSKGHVAVERNSSFGLWSKIIAHPTSPVCVTSCIWEVTEKQCTALCRMSF